MSWDVFIQDLPPGARSVREIPDEFQPRPLGTRRDVIARITGRFPDAAFAEPGWGLLQRDGFSVAIALPDEGETIRSVTLHVRGSDEAVAAVTALIEVIGGRAVDSWTGELFDRELALESIRRWRAYLEEI